MFICFYPFVAVEAKFSMCGQNVITYIIIVYYNNIPYKGKSVRKMFLCRPQFGIVFVSILVPTVKPQAQRRQDHESDQVRPRGKRQEAYMYIMHTGYNIL